MYFLRGEIGVKWKDLFCLKPCCIVSGVQFVKTEVDRIASRGKVQLDNCKFQRAPGLSCSTYQTINTRLFFTSDSSQSHSSTGMGCSVQSRVLRTAKSLFCWHRAVQDALRLLNGGVMGGGGTNVSHLKERGIMTGTSVHPLLWVCG